MCQPDQVEKYFEWQCQITPWAYADCALQECLDEGVSSSYYFYHGRAPAGKHVHIETIT